MSTRTGDDTMLRTDHPNPIIGVDDLARSYRDQFAVLATMGPHQARLEERVICWSLADRYLECEPSAGAELLVKVAGSMSPLAITFFCSAVRRRLGADE